MDIAKANYDTLGSGPSIWGEKIKQFLTPNKKGNLFFVENKLLSEKTTLEYPYVFLTGRTRDQWHSGTKTHLPTTLLKYQEINLCEIYPNDAKVLQLEQGDRIKKRGSWLQRHILLSPFFKASLFLSVTAR